MRRVGPAAMLGCPNAALTRLSALLRYPRLMPIFVLVIWTMALTMANAEMCDRFEKLVTTTPSPPTHAFLWQLFVKELPSDPVDVDLLLLGDSLAQSWPGTSLSPLRIANLGVGGDQTQQVLWRLTSLELAKFNPRKVLIVIGTNNLTMNNQPCAIVMGIEKIVQRVRDIWPRTEINFLEIPPHGDGFLSKNDERTQVNFAVRQFGGVKTMNVDDAITCRWHTPCAYYQNDKLHFSESGYQLLGQIVESTLFPN
jgi:lysophospholipase L1-like esterase